MQVRFLIGQRHCAILERLSTMIAAYLLLAMAGLAMAQVPITGEVTDASGKPVAGEVTISAGLTREGTVPIVAESRSDAAGRFSFPRQAIRSRSDIGSNGTIWALKPGLGLGFVAANDRPDTVAGSCLSAASRTITLKDDLGKPVSGVRVAPRLVQTESCRYDGVLVPDALLDRLSTITDARGVATLTLLTGQQELMTLMVTRPGIVRHVLPLPYSKGKDDVTLSLSAPTRLAGRIGVTAGPVPVDAAITIWVRCEMPFSVSQSIRGVPEPVWFETGVIRAHPDGTFETPQVLPSGGTYRVVVLREGFAGRSRTGSSSMAGPALPSP